MKLKKIIIIFIFFLSMKNLFSQEVFLMEIEVRHFRLVQMAYYDMEAQGIELSEYKILVYILNNILHVQFYTQEAYNPLMRGSPSGFPSLIYEFDITSGELLRIQGVR